MTEYTDDIRAAIAVLRRGGVILYPTDTVWGLGCDATCAEAVRRIFNIKHRADAKALITLVGSEGQLERTAAGIPDVAWQLIEFSDKPLTIVYDGANRRCNSSRAARRRRQHRSATHTRAFQLPPVPRLRKAPGVDLGQRQRPAHAPVFRRNIARHRRRRRLCVLLAPRRGPSRKGIHRDATARGRNFQGIAQITSGL